jgi:hypothetical protein
MSEAEERQKRAMALLEYEEAKQAFALLEIEVRQVADDFEGLAKLLRNDPRRLADSSVGKVPTYEDLQSLSAKITKSADDLAERKYRLQRLGFTI